MSPMFIRQFNRAYACSKCRAKTADEHKCCPHVRQKAREVWVLWSFLRRRNRLCSYCNRKAHPGEIRCRTHKAYNRRRCRAWSRVHGLAADVRQRQRNENLIQAGLCPTCPQHAPLRPGFRRCPSCQLLNQTRKGAEADRIRSSRKHFKASQRQAVAEDLLRRYPEYKKVLDRKGCSGVF